MKRLFFSILVLLTNFWLLQPCAFAQQEEIFDIKYADTLNGLGLFSGTDKGYELENEATRVQIAVTFTRILGMEEKAIAQKNAHPFIDVPSWASDCIGYLYESYLVNGVSEKSFGSNDVATPAQFCTMLLRALGYSDSQEVSDFVYSQALEFSKKVGLVDADYYSYLKTANTLKRADMVRLSYNALKTPMKNARKTLAHKLCYEQKVLDEDKAIKFEVLKKYGPEKLFEGIDPLPNTFNLSFHNGVFKGKMNMSLETFGVRLYVSENGNNYVEISKDEFDKTHWAMTKMHYEGAAQMMDEFEIYGFSQEADISVVLVKTTSTTNMYRYVGKTNPVKPSV